MPGRLDRQELSGKIRLLEHSKFDARAGPLPYASCYPYLRLVTHFKFLIVGPDHKMVTKRP